MEQLRFLVPGWGEILEILLVALLFFRILMVIQRTRAMQILMGLLVLASIYLISQLLNLQLLEYLLETLFQYGVIAALVVFQPELRTALSSLGENRWFREAKGGSEDLLIEKIVSAVETLANKKIGAIIAIERQISLDPYGETGSEEKITVSSEILETIFTPGSPLHDGAVIIVGDEIRSAGTILPLGSLQMDYNKLGTRHRAAIGLSQETDAIVIVVSEETGNISFAEGGQLQTKIQPLRLREKLARVLLDQSLNN